MIKFIHGTYILPWTKWQVEVVYFTLERLWNFIRETFALVWSPSKVFILKNSVKKSLQKIRLQNIQNRRPHGSSTKHDDFWDFSMCRASADDQSPGIPIKIRWILGNSSDQCGNHDFEVLNQSISVQGARIIHDPILGHLILCMDLSSR